jgi:hypothetical protein
VGVYWERLFDQKSYDVSGLFWWVDIMSRRAGVLAVMSTEVEMSPMNPASDWRYDDVGR